MGILPIQKRLSFQGKEMTQTLLILSTGAQNCTEWKMKAICSAVPALQELIPEPQLRRFQTFKPKANGLHSLHQIAWIKNRVLLLLVAVVSGLAHSRLFEVCIRFYWVISSYQSVLAVQMKNWDPLVLGPALAIDKIPTEQQVNLY